MLLLARDDRHVVEGPAVDRQPVPVPPIRLDSDHAETAELSHQAGETGVIPFVQEVLLNVEGEPTWGGDKRKGCGERLGRNIAKPQRRDRGQTIELFGHQSLGRVLGQICHVRDEVFLVDSFSVAHRGRREWYKLSGYTKRSMVENAVYRYKAIIGPEMRARTLARQRVEHRIGCEILNKMAALGMPDTYCAG